MKAVLISINPEWCAKIASGEKTIEVRKTRPKMNPPFKCYIYCTKAKEGRFITARQFLAMWGKRQKVVGEFICDRVTDLFANSRFWLNEDDILRTCLTVDEIRAYANGANELYGWHISNLKVYDHAHDLWEFTGLRQTKFGLAPGPITRPPQSWRYVEEEIWND